MLQWKLCYCQNCRKQSAGRHRRWRRLPSENRGERFFHVVLLLFFVFLRIRFGALPSALDGSIILCFWSKIHPQNFIFRPFLSLFFVKNTTSCALLLYMLHCFIAICTKPRLLLERQDFAVFSVEISVYYSCPGYHQHTF